jgi:hypothetical protein
MVVIVRAIAELEKNLIDPGCKKATRIRGCCLPVNERTLGRFAKIHRLRVGCLVLVTLSRTLQPAFPKPFFKHYFPSVAWRLSAPKASAVSLPPLLL